MKKILITGANSYIGTSFENYIKKFEGYSVNTVDMVDGTWRNMDFSGYDAVFHVAGIAHSDTSNPPDEVKKKYYKVNTDLTIETAAKAKADGVRQFVFMSSMIVFGSKNECVTRDTTPHPDNFYGDSKLKADIGIHKLEEENFKVVSLRPPMIYGKGSKGNYPRLAKLAVRTPIFPDFPNKRSMLYIENLCEFVRLIVDNEENGYFYPQNDEYVNTSNLVRQIAAVHNKKIKFVKCFNAVILSAVHSNITIRKVFGNLYYDKSMSKYKSKYNICNFLESTSRTENI